MISINQLNMSFGSKLLFYDVNLLMTGQKHYALVGANGTGKSTLLKLITGEEEPLAGTISVPKDMSIGWLKQDQFRYENTIITDIVLQGKAKLWEAMSEKDELLLSTDWNDKVVKRLGQLEDTINHLQGYSALAFAEKLLVGLGIANVYHHKPLSALSGGYKLRVLLAQALFQEPDILLLDEPTNHLDIVSIHWLEKYLKNEFRGLVLFISHDVAFIDRLADNILDIDYGEIRQYSGRYDKFLAEKKLIEEQKLAEKKSIEDKIERMQAFVDKFKAKASKARQAQSRVKMIEKIELPDIAHSSRVAPHFHFKPKRPSGKQILQVRKLGKTFQDKALFTNLHFDVQRGEKIAIVGENGVGKSTLIKILLGQVAPEHGSYEWGHEAHISYFSQDHHEDLHDSDQVLHWLTRAVSDTTEQLARKALAQVLFVKDDVEKNILTISGGEAARLLLAKMTLEAGNILVLDEPTNHLDIESTDALAEALRTYAGTLIFVSHDRHFIKHIANRILFISHSKGLIDYHGTFDQFAELYDL
jgi:ATPase subunit of ABC transporter with duplicated ATPase domains